MGAVNCTICASCAAKTSLSGVLGYAKPIAQSARMLLTRGPTGVAEYPGDIWSRKAVVRVRRMPFDTRQREAERGVCSEVDRDLPV